MWRRVAEEGVKGGEVEEKFGGEGEKGGRGRDEYGWWWGLQVGDVGWGRG